MAAFHFGETVSKEAMVRQGSKYDKTKCEHGNGLWMISVCRTFSDLALICVQYVCIR